MSTTRVALAYSFVEKYLLVTIALAAGMIVARRMTPAETGIFSVAAVVLGVAQVLRDFGVGQYVLQERELDATKLRAVLGAAVLSSWPLALAMVAASAPVAQFFGAPRIAPVLQLLSINFVLLPMSAVCLPLLRRQQRFGAICVINLGNGVCNAAVSVVLTLRGHGAMALAWGSVAASCASLLLIVQLHPRGMPWRPGWTGVGKVMAFGSYATGGKLIDEAGNSAPDVIIGRLIGMDAAGLFSKGVGVLAVFHQMIINAVTPVVFPLYAAHARGDGDVRIAYLRTLSYMTAFAWPFFAFVAMMALPILRLLYGDQWDAAAPLIRVMCLSSALYSMNSMARYFFVATGQERTQAQLDALTVPVRVALLLTAAPFGIGAVAWAHVAGTVFRTWLTMRYLAQQSGIGARQIVQAAAKGLLLTVISLSAPLWALLVATSSTAGTVLAAVAAVMLWLAGIVLIRHPLLEELHLARRKLAEVRLH